MSEKTENYSPDRLFGKKEDYSFTVLLVFLLVLSILLFIYNYFFAIIRVDGPSMLDTLKDEQFILFRTNAITVKRNDIVTFKPEGYDKTLIKRVIAVEDDRIMFMLSADGNYVELYICKSGETAFSALAEPYIREKMSAGANYHDTRISPYVANVSELPYSNFDLYAVHISENHFFFLGDNRNISEDARFYGTQSLDKVIGKAYRNIKPGSFFDRILSFLYGLSNNEK